MVGSLECPFSSHLDHWRFATKGGSGSPWVDVMPRGCDVASGGLGLSFFDFSSPFRTSVPYLYAFEIIKKSNQIPEGIGFGVKSETLIQMLKSSGVRTYKKAG